jgi:hypothetical protein
VVLLEPTTVAATKTLTIRPGVTVKGNYLTSATPNVPVAPVTLNVLGTLQAAGTAQHPIHFTALVEGRDWGGIVLAGRSHTLSHAFVDKAATAITVAANGSATLSDLVLTGNAKTGSGVVASQGAAASLSRSLIKGFSTGLRLEPDAFTIEDSVIRGNNVGISVLGTTPFAMFGTTLIQQANVCDVPQPAPPRRIDPIIRYTDIVDNTEAGVLVNGDNVFLEVSRTNLVRNGGPGLLVLGRMLQSGSYVRESNIHGNGAKGWTGGSWTGPFGYVLTCAANTDVCSTHRYGNVDLKNDYWVDISDPALSANRALMCPNATGGITFTGFAPTPYTAGPRNQKELAPAVQAAVEQRVD